MDFAILLEYAWVLVVLVVLEGLLAADNAVVLAVMVKHLDKDNRKKALFYGLLGAFVFRMIAILLLVWLVQWWWMQAAGALYLFYVSISHLIKLKQGEKEPEEPTAGTEGVVLDEAKKKGGGFWFTVFKVELADIAFAIDSILAAAAIALALPEIGGDFFGINAGQYTVMLIGGLVGVIIMRFFATWFVELLNRKPGLEVAAFIIVGWVGVKLAVLTLAHDAIHVIPHDFPHSVTWKLIFWAVMVIIIAAGWFLSSDNDNGKKVESLH